jgi:hypothetical protein
MSHKELKQFMVDVFKDSGRQIFDNALVECGIVDLDKVDEKKRKIFADYILKEHFNFSAQKNKYLYEQLLGILGLRGIYAVEDYRATLKNIKKKQHDIILTSFEAFWSEVEKAYYKYEIIINLFWLKGIEAERGGAKREFVEGVVRKAIDSVKSDLNDAYVRLLGDLYLTKYIKKRGLFSKKVFEGIVLNNEREKPDENTQELIDYIESFHGTVLSAFSVLEHLMLDSITELTAVTDQPDENYIYGLKNRIIGVWKGLTAEYRRRYDGLADYTARVDSMVV